MAKWDLIPYNEWKPNFLDEVVFTLINCAEEEEGYKDRASFLENKEVIEATRINPLIGPAKLRVYKLANQIQQMMND